jgi:hypothetical protein
MKVYYKATVWFGVDIENEESIPKIIERLSNGDNIDDLYQYKDIEFGSNDVMLDTEELILPQENDNLATIEIYKNGKKVWDNSIEAQVNKLT